MFPVKWNKLQLTVDINFDVVVQSVLLCFLWKGRRRENISSSSKRRRRTSRVVAMKHQGSPLICIMYSRRLQRKRERLARCDREADQTFPSRTSCAERCWLPHAGMPCSLRERTRESRVFREFSFGERENGTTRKSLQKGKLWRVPLVGG